MQPHPLNLSEEESKKLLETAQKERVYAICGYISVQKSGEITVCKNKSGFHTSHPGEGNCKYHGGVGRSLVTGDRSKFNSSKVKSLFDTAKEYKNQILKDHLETVNIVHALRTELAKGIDTAHISMLPPDKIEVIRRLLETAAKIDEMQLKRQERDLRTPEDVMLLVSKVIEIIEQEVKDVEVTRRIYSKIKDICISEQKETT